MEANKHRQLFSQRLRGLMNRYQPDRMTLEQLAARITELRPHDPHTKGWVSHKLTGKQDVTLDELWALAEIFNTTVAYLVGESDIDTRIPTTLDDPDLNEEDRAAITDLIAGRKLRRVQERQRRAGGIPDERGDS